jgi:hypothetical protein
VPCRRSCRRVAVRAASSAANHSVSVLVNPKIFEVSAQGATMALEDAIVLAESLTSADSMAAALTAFERRRRPRTDCVRAQSRRRDRARNLPPTIRSLMLSGIGERRNHQ